MPAIQIKKGADAIAIEQREGEDVAAKIEALIEQHGADNVLLDGKPAAEYRASVAAAEQAKLLNDESYRAGFEAGKAEGLAEAAAAQAQSNAAKTTTQKDS